MPLPEDWFMNVAFNYIKFASYSAIPFVVVLTLNVAVIYRTLRVPPTSTVLYVCRPIFVALSAAS